MLTILAGFIESSMARPATVPELLAADQKCVQQNLPQRRINVLERVLALGGENARIREELAGLLANAQAERAGLRPFKRAGRPSLAGRPGGGRHRVVWPHAGYCAGQRAGP